MRDAVRLLGARNAWLKMAKAIHFRVDSRSAARQNPRLIFQIWPKRHTSLDAAGLGDLPGRPS